MSWWQTFLGFFLPNVLGYGGGPAMIPLLQVQVVKAYHWVSNAQFADALALANVLPGPIATKMAVYVGYQVSGWLGLTLALLATVVPSALALIALLRLLNHFRAADPVRGMTLLVQPVIAVLMVGLTWEFGADSVHHLGWL
ncbi:MAG: chromate transporter, partial [Alicyclobacillus sp.]|nr:chromate transporter [Alicyclobacillus sp.]